ncbi:Uncharacterised protein [Legionella steigerwaltii]|uniref:Acyltransferase n=1 Tax=Legionella steigerwaltii TaxID=460 RepID=A0A378LAH9_9GAMM|nr:hypothetical protein [Legionella steigerwaltii]KTD75350.1 hypothetical protein Lstg_2525 [Legionella steigerwaltii]STY23707.1 Uncharacterised protein [Legionella steigerwaltii]
MLKQFFIFSILVLASMLIACGPIYNTEYSFVPPQSDVAKMCTAQCIQGKNDCEQSCRVDNENCRMRAQQNAMFEYKHYKEEQKRMGLPINKTVNDFDRSSSCNNSCRCESTYRACYSACGGEVREHKVCVAFCDQRQ